MKPGRSLLALGAVAALSACGSGHALQGAESNTTVQQTAKTVEQQVSRCMPAANGAPDPLLLRRADVRATFAQCTGVAKNARAFDRCAFGVVLSGLPTVARIENGLASCVQRNA